MFWARKALTLSSGVLDYNIRIPRTRNPIPHISCYPRVFWGGFTEPNRFPTGTATPTRRNTVRFGKSGQKYPCVPRNVWSGVSGTGNPNMKLVLVWHPGTGSYRLPSPKHRNILTLRSGPGTRNGVQIRTPRKIWGRYVRTWAPGGIYTRCGRGPACVDCELRAVSGRWMESGQCSTQDQGARRGTSLEDSAFPVFAFSWCIGIHAYKHKHTRARTHTPQQSHTARAAR